MKLAEQRIESLTALRAPCQQQLTALDRACDLAPVKIEELRTLCSDLTAKIGLAREMQSWTTQMRAARFTASDTAKEIEESLRTIDVDIDGEIAGLSALLTIQSGSTSEPGLVRTEDLIGQIELALNTAH